MEKKKYIQDLQDIKSIMDRSSRFISLSGMSGIIAGVVALLGAYLAYKAVYAGQDYLSYRQANLTKENVLLLVAIASGVLFISLVGGIYFTHKKAKKTNQKLWDSQSKRLLINMLIPLVAGGLICIILLSKGLIGIIAPFTLVFYGLSLVNASKYTLSEIRSLGLLQIALGILGCQFVGYGLILWAVGFGVLHIIYGVVMYKKYEL
jgi:predicted lysophospholipase L1 biosynthesis ABC-type transport system permease subunit